MHLHSFCTPFVNISTAISPFCASSAIISYLLKIIVFRVNKLKSLSSTHRMRGTQSQDLMVAAFRCMGSSLGINYGKGAWIWWSTEKNWESKPKRLISSGMEADCCLSLLMWKHGVWEFALTLELWEWIRPIKGRLWMSALNWLSISSLSFARLI